MKLYLAGLENKAFRDIMKEIGVRYALLNFSYTTRTKHTDWIAETDFIDSYIVTPGNIEPEEYDRYIDFLCYSTGNNLDFALDPLDLLNQSDTMVKLVPVWDTGECILNKDTFAITKEYTNTIFNKNFILQLKNIGYKVHGIDFDMRGITDSFQSSRWLYGKYGFWFMFTGTGVELSINPTTMHKNFIKNRLTNEGWIFPGKSGWEQTAYINGIAFKQYQDYLESRTYGG